MGKPTPKKTSRRLSKDEETVFVNNGFTSALQYAVIARGWDRKDIEDFIITYNHNNNSKIPVPTLTKGMQQEIERQKRTSQKNNQLELEGQESSPRRVPLQQRKEK